MATTTIPWGDGSGDNITLTYTSASGSQTVVVSSDANTGLSARMKNITFTSGVGSIARVLTVIQESNSEYVSITYNDVCITYNDTGIAYPYEEEYIVFADPVVEQICATNWGDGVGIKPSQAAQVTSIGTIFRNNANIVSFNELEYFTGLSALATSAFQNCSALEEITIPSSVTSIGAGAFVGCAGLRGILTIPSSVTSVGGTAFDGAGDGTCTLYFNAQINNIPNAMFRNCGFKNIYIGEGVETIAASAFRAYDSARKFVEYVDLPSTITTVGDAAFYNLPLKTMVFRATTPPSVQNAVALASGAFSSLYVPYSSDHSILNAYKAASIFSNYASKIQELNQDGTIPT